MFRIWRKRRILTVSVILIALAASAVAALKVPRTYQAASTVVLVPSGRASKTLGAGNPYLSFSNSLSTTADIVAIQLTAPQTVRELRARGFSENYTAVSESATGQSTASGSVLPGPFIAISVTGRSQDLVERTLQGIVGTVRSEVNNMQASVPRNNRISVSTLSLDPRATLSVSMTARALVVIVGLLIALALCIPLVVDAQSSRRLLRRGIDPVSHRQAVTKMGDVPADRTKGQGEYHGVGHISRDGRRSDGRRLDPAPWDAQLYRQDPWRDEGYSSSRQLPER